MSSRLTSIWIIIFLFQCISSSAQKFVTKGTDFWVGYGYHIRMTTSTGTQNSQDMILYFITDTLTNITISTPTGYTQTLTSPSAPAIITSNPLPKTGTQDVTLKSETTGTIGENKGIHIVSDRPIVAYAHIYNASVSGATLLLPTDLLEQTYYSINYTQSSNEGMSNSWFYVLATDTGTTNIRITPSANTINHAAGIPFDITLIQGQIYNVMGQLTVGSGTSYTGIDLTGSKIESIDTANTVKKKFAVFSGSGKINISCGSSSQTSADNYMVQALPSTFWGKRFITIPTAVMINNFFRICVSDPSTVVTVDGNPITASLTNNFYYEISANTPKYIVANKPISIAQYITSRGACGNPNTTNGDPEVIYLTPLEKNISNALWNSTPNYYIMEHYVNVVIPNSGTAISSFKLDGNPLSTNDFTICPSNSSYSYLQKTLSTSGRHTITSDSGFNAIAYGYGSAESYGYLLGSNDNGNIWYNCGGPINRENTVSACNQYTLPWGLSVNTSGDYTNTIQGPTGCDTNVIYHVTINNSSPDSTIQVSGNSFYRLPWGDTARQSGYYAHTYRNIYGCDSLVNYYVTVNLPASSINLNTGINISNPQRSLHVKDVLRLEPRSTPPDNPTRGDIYFDANTNRMRYYNGMNWVEW